MGCWNETCMVSNLPILPDQRVKVILIVSEKTDYLDEKTFHQPVGIPLTGKYDYYGGYDFEDNELEIEKINLSFFEFYDKVIKFKKTFLNEKTINFYNEIDNFQLVKLPISNTICTINIVAINEELYEFLSNYSISDETLYPETSELNSLQYIEKLLLEKIDDENLIKYKKLKNISKTLSLLNKRWFPTNEKSSQNLEFEQHLLLNQEKLRMLEDIKNV